MLSAIRSAARYAIENRRTFSEPSARFVPNIRVLHDVDLAEEEEKHLTERTPDRQRIRITRANEQMPVTNKFPFSRLRKEKLRAAQIPMRRAYMYIYTCTYLRILDAIGKKIIQLHMHIHCTMRGYAALNISSPCVPQLDGGPPSVHNSPFERLHWNWTHTPQTQCGDERNTCSIIPNMVKVTRRNKSTEKFSDRSALRISNQQHGSASLR
ncbi:uncharacterized protein K489DRAFT_70116 [Dissoconium aciculare CBS 342.82]|uniref:Uncharacterized protein n=1 Tax=Dissoconium aciculare CBS 342.82 TaxID=1314786 RepID=A0A6J3LUZ8_9PEZI|nr:uncharacterized protein K489DRAFT_70116 [Dissoconium aciculare CBS 342.82]KAF1819591.1 hypothetical protein K489DRAFT_70116 [Dissoconium aciculare CBS 342.82]